MASFADGCGVDEMRIAGAWCFALVVVLGVEEDISSLFCFVVGFGNFFLCETLGCRPMSGSTIETVHIMFLVPAREDGSRIKHLARDPSLAGPMHGIKVASLLTF